MNDRRNQCYKINVSGRNPSPKKPQNYVYNIQGYTREKTEEGFSEVKSSLYSERPAPTFTQEPLGPANKGQITFSFANMVMVTMHAAFRAGSFTPLYIWRRTGALENVTILPGTDNTDK
ncbi:hypothetical protein [uncultured Sphaerochaeta sp.]|uniref:hypothetical protein n=1 Tax=uncultured Sphaerochaeta sp. TaxID=886478 RepID=UPI002A0A8ACC|nr:hypothetical protein [uncultured Sphaerochaeta sp.]